MDKKEKKSLPEPRTYTVEQIAAMLNIGRTTAYLTTSIGPIPLATMTNRDWSHTGQNYLKSLFALAFQAFLIMVCVAILCFGTEYRHGRKYLRRDMGLHGLHGPAVLRPVQDRQPL